VSKIKVEKAKTRDEEQKNNKNIFNKGADKKKLK
jgi:hypothetical protein